MVAVAESVQVVIRSESESHELKSQHHQALMFWETLKPDLLSYVLTTLN